MRRSDIRGVIATLEGCLKLTEGLNVFMERRGVWSEDYGLIIPANAVTKDDFQCMTLTLQKLGLSWGLVTRNEEAFIRIYSPSSAPGASLQR